MQWPRRFVGRGTSGTNDGVSAANITAARGLRGGLRSSRRRQRLRSRRCRRWTRTSSRRSGPRRPRPRPRHRRQPRSTAASRRPCSSRRGALSPRRTRSCERGSVRIQRAPVAHPHPLRAWTSASRAPAHPHPLRAGTSTSRASRRSRTRRLLLGVRCRGSRRRRVLISSSLRNVKILI